MKKLFLLIVLAVSACAAAAAQALVGYSINKFSEIEIVGPVKVRMTHSSAANLELGTDNLCPGELKITSKGNSLDIVLETTNIRHDDRLVVFFNGEKREFPASKANKNNPVLIFVNNPAAVTDVEITGSGVLDAPALGEKGKNLDAEITGSGCVKVNAVYALALDVEITGSGLFSVSDLNVSSVKSDVTGSGSIVVDKANVTNLYAQITGSGFARISSCRMQSAQLEISGSGSMKVSGEATNASYSVAGSGIIDAASLKVKSEIKAEVNGSGNIYYNNSCNNVRKKGRQNNIIGK